MNPTVIPKERKCIKKYTKKDGTIVEKEYKQTYFVVDRSQEIKKKKLIGKIKFADKDQVQKIEDILK